MSDHSYQNAVPHTCGRPITENSSPPATEDDVPTVVEDVVEEMKAEVDALALPNLTIVPSRIWEEIREEFTSKKMIHGLTRDQPCLPNSQRSLQIVNLRTSRGPAAVNDKGRRCDILQFHYSYVDNGEVQHILRWGHPALIRLVSYHQTALGLHGTFHCVPSSFYQYIIVMVHNRGSKCFVPCMYALATNKSEWTYWSTLHCIQAATGMNDGCRDGGLINARGDRFPDIIGCLFHFKQAVRRKMQKIHNPTKDIYGMMQRGFHDALTVIPHDHIDPHVLTS
ncbi:LOW QUALITY PROTEIN: hypothetical protein PHMEG_00033952 [Phytophthora megakarya]|uniref:MULE transposase domain-containing protein n=1 Tax=Phytophthora megakarya TaxID=4795 RepID=A0A225US54_9STRA|nr:LOW QUALITY PROTEIN: hypothetical protein PHMEG_00033952 [Phytophthora megakarya]